MWKAFFLGLLTGWLIKWIFDRVWWRRVPAAGGGSPAASTAATASALSAASAVSAALPPATAGGGADPASRPPAGATSRNPGEDPEVVRPVVEPNEKFTTSADTPAGRIGGDVAMGAAGAVSTSSATITSTAPVYGQEDLEAVDGVDPKTGGLLRDNGITTFAELAVTPVTELIRITDRTGQGRGRAGLETWVVQARFAAARDWAGLAALQAELRGGGRPGGGDSVL